MILRHARRSPPQHPRGVSYSERRILKVIDLRERRSSTGTRCMEIPSGPCALGTLRRRHENPPRPVDRAGAVGAAQSSGRALLLAHFETLADAGRRCSCSSQGVVGAELRPLLAGRRQERRPRPRTQGSACRAPARGVSRSCGARLAPTTQIASNNLGLIWAIDDREGPAIAGSAEWRDPDSNRRHHDIQGGRQDLSNRPRFRTSAGLSRRLGGSQMCVDRRRWSFLWATRDGSWFVAVEKLAQPRKPSGGPVSIRATKVLGALRFWSSTLKRLMRRLPSSSSWRSSVFGRPLRSSSNLSVNVHRSVLPHRDESRRFRRCAQDLPQMSWSRTSSARGKTRSAMSRATNQKAIA
jgi:hypothetical protein